jgi:hypothetical protein
MDWADDEAVVAAGCKRVDGASAQGLFDQNPPVSLVSLCGVLARLGRVAHQSSAVVDAVRR